jgi:hypothetical protein
MTGKSWMNLVLLPVREMLKTVLLTNDDLRRPAAEEFIKKSHAARDNSDEILCVVFSATSAGPVLRRAKNLAKGTTIFYAPPLWR